MISILNIFKIILTPCRPTKILLFSPKLFKVKFGELHRRIITMGQAPSQNESPQTKNPLPKKPFSRTQIKTPRFSPKPVQKAEPPLPISVPHANKEKDIFNFGLKQPSFPQGNFGLDIKQQSPFAGHEFNQPLNPKNSIPQTIPNGTAPMAQIAKNSPLPAKMLKTEAVLFNHIPKPVQNGTPVFQFTGPVRTDSSKIAHNAPPVKFVPSKPPPTTQGIKIVPSGPPNAQVSAIVPSGPPTAQGNKIVPSGPPNTPCRKIVPSGPPTTQGVKIVPSGPPNTQVSPIVPSGPPTTQGSKIVPSEPPNTQGSAIVPSGPPTTQGVKIVPSGPTTQGSKIVPSGPPTKQGIKIKPSGPPNTQGSKIAPSGPPNAQGRKILPSGPHTTQGSKIVPSGPPTTQGIKIKPSRPPSLQQILTTKPPVAFNVSVPATPKEIVNPINGRPIRTISKKFLPFDGRKIRNPNPGKINVPTKPENQGLIAAAAENNIPKKPMLKPDMTNVKAWKSFNLFLGPKEGMVDPCVFCEYNLYYKKYQIKQSRKVLDLEKVEKEKK
jgi:hypothetical protein